MCCSVAQWSRASVKDAQVDEPRHAGGDGGIDRGAVLLDAVGGLRGRDQEDGVGARERRAHLLEGVIAGGDAHVGPGGRA